VSFLEQVGLSEPAEQARPRLEAECARLQRERGGVARPGLSPHAPYSAGAGLYEAGAALGASGKLPLCTHAAESAAELALLRGAEGPLARLLDRLGKWDSDAVPRAADPFAYLAPFLERCPWLLVHCHQAEPAHDALLARCGASVAYCPAARRYFGIEARPHARMHAQGVRLCLGTDGLMCQPPEEPQPLGILPQMRRVHEEGAIPPAQILRMATTEGAAALGVDREEPCAATLRPGAPGPLVAAPFDAADPTDPLVQVLRRRDSVEPIEI
jgi:cytosine/adenosine deaminase-related metal-dependent hydrolase